MKLKKISVLLMTAVLFCTMTGFFSNWKAENNIKKGNAEAEKGNYRKAFEYYEAAEEKGYEPAKNLHRKRADEKLAEDEYYYAMQYLVEVAKDYYTEQESLEIVMESVTEDYNKIRDNIMNEIEKAEKNNKPVPSSESIYHLYKILHFTEHKDTPDLSQYKTLLNDMYTVDGLYTLYESHPQYENTDWGKIMVSWRKCESGIGYEATQLEKLLDENKFVEIEKAISETTLHPNAIKCLLEENITQSKYSFDQLEYASLEELIAHIKLLYKSQKTPVTVTTLKEAIQNVDELKVGVDHIDYSIELNETMIQKLKETCGKAPKGKVLFIHVRTPYHTYVNLMNQYMMELPEKYYPQSMEEVEYVFVMEGTSRPTGRTYSVGTKQVQEKAVLTVYDMKTGKSVYTGQAFGPVESTMYYSGKAPSTYSAGAPDILEILQKACDKIGY